MCWLSQNIAFWLVAWNLLLLTRKGESIDWSRFLNVRSASKLYPFLQVIIGRGNWLDLELEWRIFIVLSSATQDILEWVDLLDIESSVVFLVY